MDGLAVADVARQRPGGPGCLIIATEAVVTLALALSPSSDAQGLAAMLVTTPRAERPRL